MRTIKKAVAFLLFFAVLISAIFSLSSCTSLKSTKEESAVVMTVGSYDVPYELYRYLVLNYRDSSVPEDFDWSDNDKADEMNLLISEKVLQSVKDIYAVFSLCEDYGIDADGDYISSAADSAAESAKSEFDKDSDYKASLAENNMNDSVYRLLERKNAASDELYYAIINSEKTDDNESRMREIIDSDSFICIKQILITSKSSISADGETLYSASTSHTDSEAAAIAEKAQSRAASGENFDSLVNEYGESLFMFNNTDGYYLCRGMWDTVDEDAAFALDIGEISPVIHSEKGYSVFQRLEKSESYINENFDEICTSYNEAVFTLALEKRSSELEVKTTELYDSYANSISEMEMN